MKKLLLFFALALGIGSVSAQNTKNVTELFTNDYGWGYTVNGSTITFDGDWKAYGFANWSGGIDVSKYASLTAELKNVKGITDALVVVEYVEDQSVKDEDRKKKSTESSKVAVGADGTVKIFFALDKSITWPAQAIMIKGANAGSFEIDKLYLTESAEWNLVKTLDMSSGSSWINASEFSSYTDDTKVVFTYNVTPAGSHVIADCKNWGVSKVYGGTKEEGFNVQNEGANTAELTVADLKEMLEATEKKDGIIWVAWDASNDDDVLATVSKVKIEFFTKGTSALRPITAPDAEVVSTTYYNLAGAKLSQPQRGLNIVVRTLSNGSTLTDKVVVK